MDRGDNKWGSTSSPARRHQTMSDGRGGEGMMRTKVDREPPRPPPLLLSQCLIFFRYINFRLAEDHGSQCLGCFLRAERFSSGFLCQCLRNCFIWHSLFLIRWLACLRRVRTVVIWVTVALLWSPNTRLPILTSDPWPRHLPHHCRTLDVIFFFRGPSSVNPGDSWSSKSQ